MPQPSDFGYFQIALRGDEGDYPALTDISSFLHDFNLLYEFSRVIVDPKYEGYRFSRFSTYRNNRRVEPGDQLEIQSLRIESPIELITIVAATPVAAATLWVLVQTAEKIANFSLNRDILKLQREKLRKELESAHGDVPRQVRESDAAFSDQVHTREAEHHFDRLEKRLAETPVRVKELEITHIRELPARRDSATKGKS